MRATATKSPRMSRCCVRRYSGSAGRSAAARSPPSSSTRSPSGCCVRSTSSMAVSAPRRNSRRPGSSRCCGAPGSGAARRLIATPWSRRSTRCARAAFTTIWVAASPVTRPTRDGWFASSLDADSEHEEGKFYVWTEAEIDAVLGDRAALFKRFYDVDAEGNWEGHSILNRLKMAVVADAETERELGNCRALLLRAREGRSRPGLDDKVLADWNGLMIATMANAGIVFERPGWIGLARDAFDFIRRHMVEPDQRLLHSWRAGRARHPASVDDYADLARAALALHEAIGNEDFLNQARDWVMILDRYFWDSVEGGYFFAAKDTEGLVARPKTAADSAVPAGNGTLIGVLSRLAMLTGEEAYQHRAEAILETFSGEMGRNFFTLATMLNNVELLAKPLQIVLVGESGTPAFEALRRAVYNASLPNRVLVTVSPGSSLPSNHPAAGKGLVDGKPAAYVCEGPVCSLPITDPQTLLETLARVR